MQEALRASLLRDLYRRTDERLSQLIVDTFELYGMAELSDCDAAMCLSDILMRETSKLLAASAGDSKLLGVTLAMLVRFERGEISQEEVQKWIARFQQLQDQHIKRMNRQQRASS